MPRTGCPQEWEEQRPSTLAMGYDDEEDDDLLDDEDFEDDDLEDDGEFEDDDFENDEEDEDEDF